MIKSILVALLLTQALMIRLRNDPQPHIDGEDNIVKTIVVKDLNKNGTSGEASLDLNLTVDGNHIVLDNDTIIVNASYSLQPNEINMTHDSNTNGNINTTNLVATNDVIIPSEPFAANNATSTPITPISDTSAPTIPIPAENTTVTPLSDTNSTNPTDEKEKKDKKKKDDKKPKKDKNSKSSNTTLKFKNNQFILKHCSSYSVDGYYTNFGCYECESGYQLTSDILGTGVCKGKSTITNCKTEILLRNDTSTTKCIQCETGYGTNSTGKDCKELNTTQTTIDNCQSYFLEDKGKMACLRCKAGFSLSTDGMSCGSKCNITNCDNCLEFDSVQYCNACSTGYIGVLGYPFNMINTCITPMDWFKKLFSIAVIDEIA